MLAHLFLMLRPWFLFGLLCTAGCAVGTRVVVLETPADWRDEDDRPPPALSPESVLVQIRDQRSSLEISIVGAVRNPDRMPTATVRTDTSVPSWVETCFREHLQSLGVRLAAANAPEEALVLDLTLHRCFAEGYWMPEGEIRLTIEIRRQGQLLWQRTCAARGSATWPRMGGASGYAEALEDAMQSALEFVTADLLALIRPFEAPA